MYNCTLILYYTAEAVINLLSICYESETLYYVHLYVNLYCTAETVYQSVIRGAKILKIYCNAAHPFL